MKNERKAIPGHPGYYADRTGRIWTSRRGYWQLVKSVVHRSGYQYTKIKADDASWGQQLTQRLVCAAFKGEHPDEFPVCIRQAPRQQPRRVRKQRYLKWGDRTQVKSRKGVRLTEQEKFEILIWWACGYTQCDIADMYGISQPSVSYIVNKNK